MGKLIRAWLLREVVFAAAAKCDSSASTTAALRGIGGDDDAVNSAFAQGSGGDRADGGDCDFVLRAQSAIAFRSSRRNCGRRLG